MIISGESNGKGEFHSVRQYETFFLFFAKKSNNLLHPMVFHMILYYNNSVEFLCKYGG